MAGSGAAATAVSSRLAYRGVLVSTSCLSRACALALAVALGAGCFLFKSDDDPPAGPDGGAGDTCEIAGDCAGGLVCAAGVCTSPGSLGIGAACSASRDCAVGLYCALNGVCAPAGSGGEGAICASGADCQAHLTCELAGLTGTCAAGGTGDLGDVCTGLLDCLPGLACTVGGRCAAPGDAYPPFQGAACAPDQAPFRGFFEVPRPSAAPPDFFRLPFPNDARIRADGTLDLSDFPRPGLSFLGVDLVDLYADALDADFEGFSSVAPVTFRFSSALDFETVRDGQAVFLVDITDPQAPGYGQNLSRQFGYTTGRGKFLCQHAFTLSNPMSQPLLPGRTYAAWLASSIRSSTGAAPAQDPDLVAVLGATEPTDPTLARAWNRYAPFREYLTRSSRTSADVATVAVFTVADHSRQARALAAQVEAGTLPALSSVTLCDGATASPCAGDGRACGDSSGAFWEVHGRMSVPNYQAGTLPYERPADGGDVRESGGAPVVQGSLDVCFALTVPKGSAPAAGWPLVVHAHGTGGGFTNAVGNGIAETLATAATPMATLTFDGVGHGERRGASARDPDSLVFNVINPRAARDNHLQGAVDVIQALRVAQVTPFAVPPGAVAGPGTVAFDAARVYYFGHSQGSNVGVPAIAVTDLAPAAVFSGAGSVLIEGIMNKTSPVNARAGLELLIGEPLGGGHPVMILWQTFFDRIDPINYAGMLIRRPPPGVASKHVLVTWGKGDTFSPESTMNNTAIAASLVAAAPVITPLGLVADARPITLSPGVVGGDGPVRFGALFQYDGGGAFDGHFVSTRVSQAVADWRAFLVSVAGGAPNVP